MIAVTATLAADGTPTGSPDDGFVDLNYRDAFLCARELRGG